MKRCFCLIAAMITVAATPALASEASPSAPPAPAAAQRTADHQAMSGQIRQGLVRLREELGARKGETKQAAQAAQHDANGLCTDCPDKAAEAHHHSVSAERKADCPEFIERAVYA